MCLTVFIFYPVLITQKWIFYLYWKRQDVFHGEEPRPDGQQLDDRAAIELRERAGNGDRGEGSVQQEEQHHAQTEGESVRQE